MLQFIELTMINGNKIDVQYDHIETMESVDFTNTDERTIISMLSGKTFSVVEERHVIKSMIRNIRDV